MLTHELNNFTMAEAVKFYPQLKAAFSHLVLIDVALNNIQAYLELSLIVPDFEWHTRRPRWMSECIVLCFLTRLFQYVSLLNVLAACPMIPENQTYGLLTLPFSKY